MFNLILNGFLHVIDLFLDFNIIWFVIGVAAGVALLALILIIDKKFNK